MENSRGQKQERYEAKRSLTVNVGYWASFLTLVFGVICLFLLDITRIVPYCFLGFSFANLLNTLALQRHNNLILSFNLATLLSLAAALIITWFTGGINSPFIFVMAIVVFAGYATTGPKGKLYLYLSVLLIFLVFFNDILNFLPVDNVVPESSSAVFALLSILLSVYLMGGVLAKNLLKAHIKLYKYNMETERQIKEKETLLREVHHRVKNNLQTVSSLLSLQSRSVEDVKMKGLLKSSQNRVISMAMVHEMLYMREDLSRIEYKTYVQELSEYLVRSVKGAENKVKLNIDIPDIKLGIDTAIPLGLLINEALTNALKYGIQEDSEGEINIALKKDADEDYVLNIGDNGVGFSAQVDHKSTRSLGLKLIHNLARQLKGTITRDESKKGTNYIVKFREIGQQQHLNPVA
ncbi:MAG: sensor histidine kinase [Eudoraea sp.]|nr:sensor histidine kinase [Eudoraea sp.]